MPYMKTARYIGLCTFLILQAGMLRPQTWTFSEKKVAPVRQSAEQFGSRLALHHDYAIIGTEGYYNGYYLYERNTSGVLEFRQELHSLDSGSGVIKRPLSDGFLEWSISGNYAIGGTPWGKWDSVTSPTYWYAGSASIFERQNDGTWKETQRIGASDKKRHDYFGMSVSLSGQYAAISALPGGNITTLDGSVYLFKRNTIGQWNEVQKITSPTDQGFGINLHLDGNRLIVGALSKAFVYEQNIRGYWAPVAVLTPDDSINHGWFGSWVGIMGDLAFVSDVYDSYDSTSSGPEIYGAGSVYIYQRDEKARWNLKQKVVASDRHYRGHFGWNLSVSGDHLIVGSHSNNGQKPSYAYIFQRNTNGYWKEQIKLSSSDSTDRFGIPVAISGNTALVGASRHSYDENGNNYLRDAGAVFVYETEFAGVPEQKRKSDVSIYPNPANEFININSDHSFIQYRICNQQGALIQNGNLDEQNKVDISTLNEGIYVIVLQDRDGYTASRRFLK